MHRWMDDKLMGKCRKKISSTRLKGIVRRQPFSLKFINCFGHTFFFLNCTVDTHSRNLLPGVNIYAYIYEYIAGSSARTNWCNMRPNSTQELQTSKLQSK
jgi:hypothetical protein